MNLVEIKVVSFDGGVIPIKAGQFESQTLYIAWVDGFKVPFDFFKVGHEPASAAYTFRRKVNEGFAIPFLHELVEGSVDCGTSTLRG